MTKEEIKHINWMYNRLTSLHNENPNYDYMLKFKEIIDKQLNIVNQKMKLKLKNYGDYYLELNVTEIKTTIEKKEDAKELLSNLLNVAEGLKEYIDDKK